jgi:nicotinate-nucleotide adenylyltransferase
VATGLLGGTFDPIHIAHLVMADQAVAQFGLARLVFVPAARPPHKGDGAVARFEDRLEMARRAVAGHPRLTVSDIEARREGPSYTIDTVRALAGAFPGETLYFVAGSDSLAQLGGWRLPDDLLAECRFVVAPRPGFSIESADARFRDRVLLLDAPLLDVSSSDIRGRVRRGASIRYLVPDGVEAFIREKNLYT